MAGAFLHAMPRSPLPELAHNDPGPPTFRRHNQIGGQPVVMAVADHPELASSRACRGISAVRVSERDPSTSLRMTGQVGAAPGPACSAQEGLRWGSRGHQSPAGSDARMQFATAITTASASSPLPRFGRDADCAVFRAVRFSLSRSVPLVGIDADNQALAVPKGRAGRKEAHSSEVCHVHGNLDPGDLHDERLPSGHGGQGSNPSSISGTVVGGSVRPGQDHAGQPL
jgi:hypothetical protein